MRSIRAGIASPSISTEEGAFRQAAEDSRLLSYANSTAPGPHRGLDRSVEILIRSPDQRHQTQSNACPRESKVFGSRTGHARPSTIAGPQSTERRLRPGESIMSFAPFCSILLTPAAAERAKVIGPRIDCRNTARLAGKPARPMLRVETIPYQFVVLSDVLKHSTTLMSMASFDWRDVERLVLCAISDSA